MLTVKKVDEKSHTWQITANTGRNPRYFRSKIQTPDSGGKKGQSVIVLYTQDGKPEFMEVAGAGDNFLIPADTSDGYYIQINARTNTSSVAVSFDSPDPDFKPVRQNCFINSDSYVAGSLINNDPGSESEFMFSLNLWFDNNTTTRERGGTVTLTDTAGHALIYYIVQSAAEAVITVSPTAVSVPSAGGSGIISVSSNDTWEVTTE